jgi:hypothetical protein
MSVSVVASTYGLSMSGTTNTATIVHDDTSCTACSHTNVYFYLYCYTYYGTPGSNQVQSDNTRIRLYDSCDTIGNYALKSDHPTTITVVQYAGVSNELDTTLTATDWLTRPKASCVFEDCDWK